MKKFKVRIPTFFTVDLVVDLDIIMEGDTKEALVKKLEETLQNETKVGDLKISKKNIKVDYEALGEKLMRFEKLSDIEIDGLVVDWDSFEEIEEVE